jgi:hypothetical protein
MRRHPFAIPRIELAIITSVSEQTIRGEIDAVLTPERASTLTAHLLVSNLPWPLHRRSL